MVDGQSGPADIPLSEMSYSSASSELEDIVAFFEQRDVDVDQLVTRLERATAIVEELDLRLRKTRLQVEELVPKLERASSERTKVPNSDDGGFQTEEPSDDPQELF